MSITIKPVYILFDHYMEPAGLFATKLEAINFAKKLIKTEDGYEEYIPNATVSSVDIQDLEDFIYKISEGRYP